MHESPELLPILYQQLRNLAQSRLAREAASQTLTPTELVHEAYMRLVSPSSDVAWDSEAHFFGAAALAMRRILIDAARKKCVRRRAGALPKISLDELDFSVAMSDTSAAMMLDVDESLSQLAVDYPEEAELVQMRFFAGLTMDEAAKALNISRRTAQRRWAFAKAAMHRLMNDGNDNELNAERN